MSLLAIKKTLRLFLAGCLAFSVGFVSADEESLKKLL